MSLSTKQEAGLKRMPRIETKLTKSKDGKQLLHKTIITNIKPVAYYKAVVENAEQLQVDDMDMDQIAAEA